MKLFAPWWWRRNTTTMTVSTEWDGKWQNTYEYEAYSETEFRQMIDAIKRDSDAWICPSCGQDWQQRPLEDDVIGCPECGSFKPEKENNGFRRTIEKGTNCEPTRAVGT